ncbi:MAG TPA: hypothetical protein VF411_00940, partial [Bacteroidia bacterium]
MKKTITTLAIAFSISTLAQISIGTVEEKKPVPQQVEKPPVYDSLSDFQTQVNHNYYKQYIGFKFYLPPYIVGTKAKGPLLYPTGFKGTISIAGGIYDTYYTLLSLSAKRLQYGEETIYFALKNEKSGDTLYWVPKDGEFILVPYFVKQKSLYEKKTFIY